MKRDMVTNQLFAPFLFIFIIVDNVYGYIDPGTGSMFLQILLAALFASLFFIKGIVERIKIFFKKLFSK